MGNIYANVDGFSGKHSRKKWETHDSQNVYDNVLLHNQTDAAPSGNTSVEEYNTCV